MGDPMFCRRCGSKLKDGSRFCTVCGGSIADDTAAPGEAAASSGNELIWRVDVPLLSNRFIWTDMLLGTGATVLLGGTIIGGIFATSGGGLHGFSQGFLGAAIFGVFILLVGLFTFAVIFGNRWPLEFVVGEHGVVQNNVSEKAHAIHRLSWILALVTGRPLMAGPGLIAQSREVVAIQWEEVRTVRKYPELGVIAIHGAFMDNVRLYCTPSNFAAVAQRVETAVKQYASAAVIS